MNCSDWCKSKHCPSETERRRKKNRDRKEVSRRNPYILALYLYHCTQDIQTVFHSNYFIKTNRIVRLK